MAEIIATGHCMRCDSGFEYRDESKIHDACPKCGEFKEFSILFQDSIDDTASSIPSKCPACSGAFIVETLSSWLCADCGATKEEPVSRSNGR